MSNIFSTLTLEQNPAYVDELEAKYHIQLPPIFKAFVQTFEFGNMNPSPQHLIIHPNQDIASNLFNRASLAFPKSEPEPTKALDSNLNLPLVPLV
jgi:hypothetical protein